MVIYLVTPVMYSFGKTLELTIFLKKKQDTYL